MKEFDFETLVARLDDIREFGSGLSALIALTFSEVELPTLFCWILDRLESEHGFDSHSILEQVHHIFPIVYELNDSLDDGDDFTEEWNTDL